MLSVGGELRGATVAAADGDVGEVVDVFFDDRTWTVRWLVVDTGTWLPGRRVLISPISVRAVDAEHRRVAVELTRAQVEGSPGVDADQPVSRQKEIEFYRYYSYPYYWAGPLRWGPAPAPADLPLAAGAPPPQEPPGPAAADDARLRSAEEVEDYVIAARDGDIGHVDDFLVDESAWAIRWVVVDTTDWWPGGTVLVAPEWIGDVRWEDSRLVVDLSREAIRGAPPYRPGQRVTREYEARLLEHYRRPRYWEEAA